MYIYDRQLGLSPPHDYLNYVPGSKRYSDAGSRSGLGLGGVSGVRFARVEQQGAVIHSSTLGTGTVEIRSGEVLILEEMRNGKPTGKTKSLSGFLALEYKGNQAPVTKWLQFAWFELTANIPGVTNRAVFPGSLPSIGGSPRQFTTNINTPQWFVDSASPTDPFYDSAGGLAIGSTQSITIFDRPGMLIEKTVPTVFEQAKAKSGVKADSVAFAAHFDTYLIQNNVLVYRVPWVAKIVFTRSDQHKQIPPVYAIEGTPEPTTTLHPNLAPILHTGYPRYTNIQ